jgi:chromosome segregation ATPase
MHESAESQLREYQTQLTEARNRVDTLEELTSIAKRVAETKVSELESLTAKSTELEAELAKAKDGLQKQEEAHSEVLRKLRADIKETRSTLGEEVSGLMEQLEQRDETIRELKVREQASENEVEEMKRLMDENSRAIEMLETEALELKNRKRDLELELVS